MTPALFYKLQHFYYFILEIKISNTDHQTIPLKFILNICIYKILNVFHKADVLEIAFFKFAKLYAPN